MLMKKYTNILWSLMFIALGSFLLVQVFLYDLETYIKVVDVLAAITLIYNGLKFIKTKE